MVTGQFWTMQNIFMMYLGAFIPFSRSESASCLALSLGPVMASTSRKLRQQHQVKDRTAHCLNCSSPSRYLP